MRKNIQAQCRPDVSMSFLMDRRRRAEGGEQRAEDGGQRAEGRGRRLEDRRRKKEIVCFLPLGGGVLREAEGGGEREFTASSRGSHLRSAESGSQSFSFLQAQLQAHAFCASK